MSDHGYLIEGMTGMGGRFDHRIDAQERRDHLERFIAGLQSARAGTGAVAQREHEEVASMLAMMPDNVLHAIAPHLLDRLLDGWDARDALLEALDEAAPELRRRRHGQRRLSEAGAGVRV